MANTPSTARSRLAASWQRSWLKHGLDPGAGATAPELHGDRLREGREELAQVLAVAAPKLDDLYAMIGHCGCGILLTDAKGLVIDARAGAADADVFRAWGLTPGADWSEAAQGTNGVHIAFRVWKGTPSYRRIRDPFGRKVVFELCQPIRGVFERP